MRVNVKGIGVIEFPDGVSKQKIKEFLSDRFSTKKDPAKEEKALKTMIMEVIREGELIKPPPDVNVEAPNVNVESPKVEIAAPDIKPIADAIAKINIPAPNVDLHIQDELKQMEIEVTSRDINGHIKTLLWSEL